MAVDDRFQQQFAEIKNLRERQRADGVPLHGGGGGGTFDGMEPRIARLEKQTEQLVKDFGDLRVDMATLKENVRHLPTKDELGSKLRTYFTIAVSAIGVMIAGATFAVRALGS